MWGQVQQGIDFIWERVCWAHAQRRAWRYARCHRLAVRKRMVIS